MKKNERKRFGNSKKISRLNNLLMKLNHEDDPFVEGLPVIKNQSFQNEPNYRFKDNYGQSKKTKDRIKRIQSDEIYREEEKRKYLSERRKKKYKVKSLELMNQNNSKLPRILSKKHSTGFDELEKQEKNGKRYSFKEFKPSMDLGNRQTSKRRLSKIRQKDPKKNQKNSHFTNHQRYGSGGQNGMNRFYERKRIPKKLKSISLPYKFSSKSSEQILLEYKRQKMKSEQQEKSINSMHNNKKISLSNEKGVLRNTEFLTECEFNLSTSISAVIDEYLDIQTLMYIVSYLDFKNLIKICFVCKSFYAISCKNWVWKSLCYNLRKKYYTKCNNRNFHLCWKRMFFKLPKKLNSNMEINTRIVETKKEFKLFDWDNDDIISLSDFTQTSEFYMWKLTDRELNKILNEFDDYREIGGISFQNFQRFTQILFKKIDEKIKNKKIKVYLEEITDFKTIQSY